MFNPKINIYKLKNNFKNYKLVFELGISFTFKKQ